MPRRETFASRADACAALGLAADASLDEARSAYRRLAQTHHPDRGGDAAIFDRAAAAWDYVERHPEPGDDAPPAPAAMPRRTSVPEYEPAPVASATMRITGCLGFAGLALVFGVLALVAFAASSGDDVEQYELPRFTLPDDATVVDIQRINGSDPRAGASPARHYVVIDAGGLSATTMAAAFEVSGWALSPTTEERFWFSHAGTAPDGAAAYLGRLDQYLDTPAWFVLDGDAPNRLGRFAEANYFLVQVFEPPTG